MHALTDGAGRVLVVLLTGGNVHDSLMFAQLMAALRVARTGPGRHPHPPQDHLLADKGLYGYPANLRTAPRPRHRAHHPWRRPNQAARRPPPRGRPVVGRPGSTRTARHAVNEASNAASASSAGNNGVASATRYDKHARNYAGVLNLALRHPDLAAMDSVRHALARNVQP